MDFTDYKKKYKELVEILNKANEDDETKYKTFSCVFADIMPKTRMSEDERIGDEIIHFLTTTHDTRLVGNGKQVDEWVSWIEKQGEHANFRNKIQVGDKVTRNEDGIIVNISQLNRIAKPRVDKSAYTVKPKFHEGDFIKHNKSNIIYKVISANTSSYCVENIETGGRAEVFFVEQNFHRWSVEDAKDGDVLAYVTDEEDLWIMIYWSLYEPYEGHVHYHALLVNDNFSDKGTCCICINDLKPATKEQRDTLFAKMKESGYTWSEETHELKEIKFTKSESEEELSDFESALFSAFSDGWQQYLHGEEVDVAQWAKEHSAELLEAAKQSPAEWSEEDEKNISTIRIALRDAKLDAPQEFESYGREITVKDFENAESWLKSIKDRVHPQNHWKPSKEQMEALKTSYFYWKGITKEIPYAEKLESLYEQLKKLTE